jgi:DNA-binding CsgD family transcriptional regulator/tetratricopeptide (TPR) repeat protein
MSASSERSFLERDEDLAALLGAWARIERSAAGSAVLIAGEAGIGKTALVREFCDRQPRAPVLWGGCDPLATPAPLGPLVEIASELGAAPAGLIAQGARPYEVARALLDDLTGGRTTVVVLEDLHWADEGTLDALAYLLRRIERVPALVICTYRYEELEPGHALRAMLGGLATVAQIRRLPLAPLSAAAVEALAQRAGRDPSGLLDATGGNPFYVTELLAGPSGELPATLRDAVLARAAPLERNARALLDLAALNPSGAELWLLERSSESGLDGLDACVERGMLERHGDELRFRHELARVVLEQELGPGRAAGFHARLLRALEQTGAEPSRLVHHAQAAGDREALFRHSVAAAERAAALHSHREAVQHYLRAVDASVGGAGPERAELLGHCAFELYLVGRTDEAVSLQAEVVALLAPASDRLRYGDALRWLSRFLWFGGRSAEAKARAAEAVAVLEAQPPSAELAWTYSGISQQRMLSNELEPAIASAEKARALAARLDVPEVEVHALANIGSAQLLGGDFARGVESLERSRALARLAGLDDDVGRSYTNVVGSAVEQRHLELAQRHLTEGIAFCDEHDLTYALYLRAWQAQLLLHTGRWNEAAGLVLEVLDLGRGTPLTAIVAAVAGGRVAARTGDEERARRLLDDAYAHAARTGELQRLAPVAIGRAELVWLIRKLDEVDEVTADAVELAAERGHVWALGELTLWRHRAGLSSPAGEVPAPVEAELSGDGERAAALWKELGCPYDAALASASSDREPQLREALAELQRLGAMPAARIVARRLRELGARDVPRGPNRATTANPATLTPRELDVLGLLSLGLRNAEIASRLVVSPRTIDHHVASILSKLGVRTRGQAAGEAVRLGLAADR